MIIALHVDWSHMDWAVFASTLVLAAVTLGLVWFTRRLTVEALATRDEMRLDRLESETARLQSVRPRLVLGVDNLGAGLGFLTITNVGQGAAINVRARMTFEDLHEARQISFHLIPVGDARQQQFLTPRNAGGELMRMDELTGVCSRVTLVGTMSDALGRPHDIDEAIDIAAVWQDTVNSHRRLPPDHEKRVADDLKKIRENLEKANRLADRVYYTIWPPSFGNDADDGDSD